MMPTQPLPGRFFNISFSLAPRYPPDHPWMVKQDRSYHMRHRWQSMLDEWDAIYSAAPPLDSRVRAHYEKSEGRSGE